MKSLEQLRFDNRYAGLRGGFHTPVDPTPPGDLHLVSANPSAAALLDLAPDQALRPEFVDYMGGKRRLEGMRPLAMCYAGHQFGHYVPRLGDGRAILLGTVRNDAGETWDLHLKGAGPTPYSRGGDGRAVLRSTIREYLCSEAMHGLGIPTTRALCIIGGNEEVYRERIEPGAMLVRLAPSHVRFGSFEYFYYSNRFDRLQQLADHVIAEHFPELRDSAAPCLAMLEQAVQRTARLIAAWQAAGFAHGVMNSDNMSILGLTLDYGPFGFLDAYQPGLVCNHSDHHGRYAFDRQPAIGLFNLSCLAQALLPLLDDDPQRAAERAQAALAGYEPALVAAFADNMRAKLGLQRDHDEDRTLCADLLQLLADCGADYTLFFRTLSRLGLDYGRGDAALRALVRERRRLDDWLARYRRRLRREHSDDRQRQRRMQQVNPKYVLRNYMAEIAIRKAEEEGDYTEIDRLLYLLQRPFDEHPDLHHYAAPPPDWAADIAVSCSS
ncbi:MAG: YdiU family protein [Gammaproteobacteria bacterium]